ncbi:unnamed protein product, partial [Pocillopora meandrina]
NICCKKLEKAVGHPAVVKLFCRATSKAMKANLKASLKHSPDQVVLYVDSNNLKYKKQIENSSDATSAISRLTSTWDEFNRAVKDANKHLKSYCRQNGRKLIQHLKIIENGLIKGGLHLSYKGNQNIFNNFNALSADFLRAQCIKSNSESRILNESGREGPT